MMLSKVLNRILPQNIYNALLHLNADKLYELRIRGESVVTVGYWSGYYYLTPHGTSAVSENAINVRKEEIEQIVIRACEKSMYAVNDKLRNGFLTLDGGIRLGITGETVFENGSIKTIKNFTAVNIRIPHEAIGCGEKPVNYIRSKTGYYSTLVISPPGAGKTTLLRDIARIVSSESKIYNVLIADERDEIAASFCGTPLLNVGINTDIISACTKEYAFINAIRAMRPDVIITDELCGAKDIAAVRNAISSGVCVFASVHSDNVARLKEKEIWRTALENKLFARYIEISSRGGPGTIERILDENFNLLYKVSA